MARKGALPVQTRQAICADSVAGLKLREIAEKYGVHRVTVSKVLARFRREVPNNVLANPEGEYRTRLKRKSIRALDSALDCDLDAYKRGGIALQVMRGIGEFCGDERQAGFTITIGPVPPGLEPETIDITPEGIKSLNEQPGQEKE